MQKVALNAVAATTTSDGFSVENLKELAIQLIAADIDSGNGAFEVHGSLDGTNWVTLAVIDNLATTNSETLTRVTSKTLSSNTSVMVFLDPFVKPKLLRVKVTRTTDGTYSAIVFGTKHT